jgi:hypothetical protein
VLSALGGVLFVDEAYALVQSDKDTFGSEAVDTLIKAMEDYRDKVVVILAGYEDEMSTFLDANPGFKSRIPFNFYFQDYTCSELETIAGMQYQKQSLSLAPNAGGTLQAVLRFTTGCCEELHNCEGQRSHGNGRAVRNFVEASVLEVAARCIREAEASAAREGSIAAVSLSKAAAQSLAAQVGDKEKQVCAELSTVTVADLQAVLAESVNVALGSVCSAGGDFETSTEAISEDLLVSEPEVVPHFFKPQDLRQRLLTIQRLETPSRAGGLPELAQQLFEKCVDRAGALGAALMTRLGTDCAEGSAKGIAQYIPKRGKKVGGEEVQYIDQVDLMQARIKSVKMMAELADATKAPSTASRWKYEIDFNTQLCEKKVTSVYQTKLDVVYLDLATLVDALPTAPAPGMDPTAPGQ